MNPERPRRWWTGPGWIAVAISPAVYGVIAFLPSSWETYDAAKPEDYELVSVTVLRPEWCEALNWLFLLSVLLPPSLSVLAFFRGRCWLGGIALSLPALAFASVFIAFDRHGVPFRVNREIRGPDGATFCWVESSFLQGQTLVLGRVRSEDRWTRTVDVLVVTTGDSPRSYLKMVRPAGAADTYAQLYLTDDGWLLGIRNENRCFFAYDLRSGRPYGYGAVEELSPFLALEHDSELHEPDAVMLRKETAESLKGYPKEAAIRTGRDHPNPRVRALAAHVLERRP